MRGQTLNLICTSIDFKPVQELWADGRYPFTTKRFVDKINVYNADQMPWWRWDKYLSYCRSKNLELCAYGSIQRCLSGVHGAFVHLIHTFRTLKQHECMGYKFHVDVSSFQLEGIFEKDVSLIERKFIEMPPSPVFNVHDMFKKHCKIHDVWKSEVSFLGLLQASNMKPKFEALPIETLSLYFHRPIVIEEKKKRRIDAASSIR